MVNNLIFSLFILLAVGLNTGGQVLLKMGTGQNPLNLYLIGGLGLYAIGTVFYILVLGKFNLSVAYPTVIGLTLISTTISGMFFLQEKVTFIQWMGVGLMIGGISAISLGKIW